MKNCILKLGLILLLLLVLFVLSSTVWSLPGRPTVMLIKQFLEKWCSRGETEGKEAGPESCALPFSDYSTWVPKYKMISRFVSPAATTRD